jgi:hypothetical protein
MKWLAIIFFLLAPMTWASSMELSPITVKDRLRMELLVEGIPEFQSQPTDQPQLPVEVLSPLKKLELSLK